MEIWTTFGHHADWLQACKGGTPACSNFGALLPSSLSVCEYDRRESLSRALIVTGDLAPAVNAWWVGTPTEPAAASRAAALGLGEVVTRANVSEQLTRGPLRVGLPAALAVLIPAAGLLVLAGGDYRSAVLGAVNYGRDSDSTATMQSASSKYRGFRSQTW